MLNLSKTISFLKTNKDSGVWLESGVFKVLKDVNNGRSEGFVISSSMFQFLNSFNLLAPNDYMGFKGFRSFPKNPALNKVKASQLQESFDKLQNQLKKDLEKDKQLLIKVSQVKFISVQQNFCKNLQAAGVNEFHFHHPSYSRYGGTPASKLFIGKQSFNYCQWKRDYKKIAEYVQNRIAKIDAMIAQDQINEYVSYTEYSRAPLPPEMARLARSLGIAA